MQLLWDTIEFARQGDGSDFQGRLLLRLLELSAEERLRFEEQYRSANLALESPAVHRAPDVLWGGCSDDGFMDFKSWVLAQGWALYDAVLSDPIAALKPWAHLSRTPSFEGAIFGPLYTLKRARSDLTAASLRAWIARRDRADLTDEDARAALAALSASEPIADIAGDILRRCLARHAELPAVLLEVGQATTPEARAWVDALCRRDPGAEHLERLTLADAPAVRLAADQRAELAERRHHRTVFRAIRRAESPLVVPVVLSICARLDHRHVPPIRTAIIGRLALNRLLHAPDEEPAPWIRLLGQSATPPAIAWLTHGALRGRARDRWRYYEALASAGSPLAVPELLRRHVESGMSDDRLDALRAMPTAPLLEVIRDRVRRLEKDPSWPRCWQLAVELLAEREPTPAVCAALRAPGAQTPSRRLVAAWGLAMLGEPDGASLLVAELRRCDADPDHRGPLWIDQLIEALGRIRCTEALPLLAQRAREQASATTLLALVRIEPEGWRQPLIDAVPQLLGDLGECVAMYEEGMITTEELAVKRRELADAAALLVDRSPEVAAKIRDALRA